MSAKERNPENVPQTQLDNRMAKAKPVKLGWTFGQTVEITKSLNDLLANYSIHHQRLRSYHWNVKGPDFFDLHERFESFYKDAIQDIDDVAERIRIFGETPVSTLQEYLDMAELKETTAQLSSELMVRELLSDFRILLQYMFIAETVAAAHGDSGTEEMIKRFIRAIEKKHWMLSAFMAK
jgi:starvation-inducible DNA-binding protein